MYFTDSELTILKEVIRTRTDFHLRDRPYYPQEIIALLCGELQSVVDTTVSKLVEEMHLAGEITTTHNLRITKR